MEIFIVPIPKAKLDKIPKDERAFYIHIGHVRNEIAVLQKLLKWSINDPTDSQVVKNVNLSVSFIIDRLLAGKIYEAWQLLERAYIETGVRHSIESQLSKKARAAFDELERYFANRKNAINKIRNRFAFHYDPQKVLDQIAAIEDTHSLEIYASEKQANLFYLASEEIVGSAMLDTVKRGDYTGAIQKLTEDITSLSLQFMNFADGCLLYMKDTYLGSDLKTLAARSVEIPEPLHRDEILLPFFSK